MRRFGRAAGRRLVAWACAVMAPFALVNPSIAAVPFGNARILYFEPFSRLVSGAVEAPAAAASDLSALIEGHIRTAAANSWIASLLVHEVLPEGGKFRAMFVRDVASRLLPMLVELIEQGRREGKFRADLDARLTALSILSLNIFPLISRPITGPILGFKFEGSDLDRLITHTTRLLLQGIAASDAAVQS